MKIFKTFLCVLITAVPIIAQQGSNLFQVITSDLPVQRNEIYRDLQTMLSDESSRELKGFNLNILHDLLNHYKNTILHFVKPLELNYNNITQKYSFSYRDGSLISVEVNADQTINLLLAKLQVETQTKLESVLKVTTQKFLSNNRVADIMFFITYKYLAIIDGAGFNYEDNDNYLNLTSLYISNIIENKIKKVFVSIDPNINLNTPINKILDSSVVKINKEFINLSNLVNDEVVTIFNTVNTIITNEVEKPLRDNLKGLTGFSASEGTGTFSGGALYSFRALNNKASLSIYTNFNLNTAQDTVAHSLIGLRSAYAWDKVQLDVLSSIYYGDKEFDAFKVFEFGFGLNYRFTGGYVLGLAGFYTHNSQNTDNSAYSVGIMFSIAQYAPSVVLGFSSLQNSGDKNPIIQINYPLNVSL